MKRKAKPVIAKNRENILETNIYYSHKAKKADQCQAKICQPTNRKKIPRSKQLLSNPAHKKG